MMMNNGLIHIYYGDGKGKTTAAVGLAVRAAGNGMKVRIVQFLKSAPTGELKILEDSGIRVLRGDKNCTFTNLMDEEMRQACLLSHNAILDEAINTCVNEQIDLLVLDEIIGAYNHALVDRNKLLGFLKNKPARAEIVLTGRDPAPELLELADYISEIKKIKHPFDRGVAARTGIEK